MEEFLKKIGILQKGTVSDDDGYVIDFASDMEWSQAQSKLDKSDLVDEDSEASQISMESAVMQYYNDDYNITMKADFNADKFTLAMREV